MWIRLPCLFACLVVCRCANIADIENLLVDFSETSDSEFGKYKACDHESGDDARCVKKSICDSLESKTDPNKEPEKDPATGFILKETVEGGCASYEVCCPESKIRLPSTKPKEVKPLGCGYSNPGGSSLREFADKYTYSDFADFPWMVALLITKDRNNIDFARDYIGGGSLIHPSVVITVAHKVDQINKAELVCRAGEWNTTTEKESQRHQERDVNQVILHNEYLRAYAHNDVALLVLKTPFELANAPHIGLACLEPRMPQPGTECLSTGWGRDLKEDKKTAVTLKKLTLPMVDGEKCQNRYRNSRLGRGYKLHKSLTCAGGEENVDTCLGDGGSPLMCLITDKNYIRYSVVGLVVYGLECGTAELPGVYLKVPQIYNWVTKEMAKLGFNKSFVY